MSASHLTDTLKAGSWPLSPRSRAGVGRRRAGANSGTHCLGAKFDKIGKRFAFTREAAHSRSRILRARAMPPATRWCARSLTYAARQPAFSDWIDDLRSTWRWSMDVVAAPSF